jgi:hypothetical protein
MGIDNCKTPENKSVTTQCFAYFPESYWLSEVTSSHHQTFGLEGDFLAIKLKKF